MEYLIAIAVIVGLCAVYVSGYRNGRKSVPVVKEDPIVTLCRNALDRKWNHPE